MILVGEIRDRQTAPIALSAAETGTLCYRRSTCVMQKVPFHGSSIFFLRPYSMKFEAQLAMGLRAVVSQHLLPNLIPGEKRELALEVMFNNSAIAMRFASEKSSRSTTAF